MEEDALLRASNSFWKKGPGKAMSARGASGGLATFWDSAKLDLIEEVRAPQAPINLVPQPVVSSPSKEHIILGSETGAESSEEGDTEASSLSGTPD